MCRNCPAAVTLKSATAAPLRCDQNDSDGVVISSMEVWVDSGCGVRESLDLTRDGADLKLFGRQGDSFSMTFPDIFRRPLKIDPWPTSIKGDSRIAPTNFIIVFSSMEVWVDSGCGVRESLDLTRDGVDLKLFSRQWVSFSLTFLDIF